VLGDGHVDVKALDGHVRDPIAKPDIAVINGKPLQSVRGRSRDPEIRLVHEAVEQDVKASEFLSECRQHRIPFRILRVALSRPTAVS
jgi:hypothetical protein